MALMYAHGIGVSADPAEARRLYATTDGKPVNGTGFQGDLYLDGTLTGEPAPEAAAAAYRTALAEMTEWSLVAHAEYLADPATPLYDPRLSLAWALAAERLAQCAPELAAARAIVRRDAARLDPADRAWAEARADLLVSLAPPREA